MAGLPSTAAVTPSLAEQVVLNEETTYNRVGATKALGSVMLLGSSILRHGSEEQKQKFLPIIRAGEMNFCLGYSEPEAGSDLASLRTRAVRDGDEWVINGQKLWTTGAHVSDWVWLAARTDPDAQPRHAGITVFLFPDRYSRASRSSSTPRCPARCHAPSSTTTSASPTRRASVRSTAAGRSSSMPLPANGSRWATSPPRCIANSTTCSTSSVPTRCGLVGPRGSAKRAAITDLAVRVQATRALVTAAVQASSTDIGAMFDAAMAGVMGGDLVRGLR